ncbi:MAG: SpoIIE family protein phosphatase, partial [Oscillospiraceae bacterium]
TCMLVAFAYRFNGYKIVLIFAEGFIASGATYFFVRSLEIIRQKQSLLTLKKTDVSCIIISLCIFIAALSSITFAQLSLGRIIAIEVILLAAYMGGEAVATMGGVACGTAVMLASPSNNFLLTAYALSGLVSGMFAPLGKIAASISFLTIHSMICLAASGGKAGIPFLLEGIIAAIIFSIIPAAAIEALRNFTFKQVNLSKDKGLKPFLISQLEEASFALNDVAVTTRTVSENLSKMRAENLSQVSYQAVDTICRKCGLKAKCWQDEHNNSMDCLNSATLTLKKKGKLEVQDLTEPLAGRCIYKDKLTACLTQNFLEYNTKQNARRKLSEIRSVVTDQFEGMAQLIDGITGQISVITAVDNGINQKVNDYFNSLKTEPLEVISYTDKDNRLYIRVKLFSGKLARLDKQLVTDELSSMIDYEFALPILETQDTITTLLFCEKPKLFVKIGYSQHNCGENKLCGDCYSVFNDKQGQTHLVLSDGMGSGSSAAVDSTLTVSLIRKLIHAGIGYDAALKLVNSALLVKSGEESLSTLDAASINLYTGKVNFYKAGAAPTFIKKFGKTGYLESTSMPVGILTDAAFEKSSTLLKDGDIVLMLSDGATTSGTDWIKLTLEKFEGDNLQALCEDIVKTAKLKRVDGYDDDITALAALIQRSA